MHSGSTDPSPRRFNLGDSLILMAAFAFSLVTLRATGWFERFPERVSLWWRTTFAMIGLRRWDLPWATRRQATCMLAAQVMEEIFVGLLSAVLLGLTLVQPVLRLRRPRPSLREVIRQSGLVASLGMIVGSLIAADLWWFAQLDPGYWFYLAATLILIWPLLGVFPWRSEPSWIDRLGRAVGSGWIIAMAAAGAAAYFYSQA